MTGFKTIIILFKDQTLVLGHTELCAMQNVMTITNQQHIFAGEISVDDASGVEKRESKGDIMTYVDLDVVGDQLWGAF